MFGPKDEVSAYKVARVKLRESPARRHSWPCPPHRWRPPDFLLALAPL